jgi:hypothetical protein
VNAVDKNVSHTGIGAGLPSDHRGDAVMESYQWFLLGVMVAWTPGLLVLALLLRRRNIGHVQHTDRHRPSPAHAMDLVQTDRRVTGRALNDCPAPGKSPLERPALTQR